MITLWFLQSGDRSEELLTQYRARLDEGRKSQDDRLGHTRCLKVALLTAAGGNTEVAVRLVRGGQRAAAEDLTELLHLRHHACRILGMTAAATAAVKCIREDLAEPSYVVPFVECFLPY